MYLLSCKWNYTLTLGLSAELQYNTMKSIFFEEKFELPSFEQKPRCLPHFRCRRRLGLASLNPSKNRWSGSVAWMFLGSQIRNGRSEKLNIKKKKHFWNCFITLLYNCEYNNYCLTGNTVLCNWHYITLTKSKEGKHFLQCLRNVYSQWTLLEKNECKSHKCQYSLWKTEVFVIGA